MVHKNSWQESYFPIAQRWALLQQSQIKLHIFNVNIVQYLSGFGLSYLFAEEKNDHDIHITGKLVWHTSENTFSSTKSWQKVNFLMTQRWEIINVGLRDRGKVSYISSTIAEERSKIEPTNKKDLALFISYLQVWVVEFNDKRVSSRFSF